ncbi:hypothetical protein PRN20_22040 [Devosia sp. ZB163]|nr:hypothetical protein [Devosia sp. ZB163]MDC9826426.1 hypothetical protein [Devosia sp. ZB163]
MSRLRHWLFTGEAARRRWFWLGALAVVLIVLYLTGNLRTQ